MVDMRKDPITLVPTRHEQWREQFHAERERILDALAARGLDDELVRIEHVGSTSVPDLDAKDIVDLDVIVGDDSVPAVSSALLAELGGDCDRNSDAWHPVFREEHGQRFNDHVFAVSENGWKISVATREVLRADEALREEYEELKRDIASQTDNIEEYSRSKTAFIDQLLDRARTDDDVTLDFDVPDER